MKRFSLQKAFLVLAATTLGSPVFAWTYNRDTNYGLPSNRIFAVNDIGSGYITFAGTEYGVSVSINNATTSWTNYTTSNGLGSNKINSLYSVSNYTYNQTSGGWVYAGTDNGVSVSYLSGSNNDGSSWTNYTTSNGLGSNKINQVFAKDSFVYAATDNGVSISSNRNGSSWTNYTTSNGLGSNKVYSVYAFGNYLYAGTDNGVSVSSNNGVSWTNYTTSNGLVGNRHNSVFATAGYLYAADDWGLSVSSNNGVSWTYSDIGIGPNAVLSIDSLGPYLVAGTLNGLAVSITNGLYWTTFTTQDGLGGNCVNAVQIVGGYNNQNPVLFAATRQFGGLGGGVFITNLSSLDVAIPEPSTYGIGLSVLALAAVAVRRKKTKRI